MKTYDIITLTINPALDKSAQFSGLIAEQKIRCNEPRYDAGGGGINASKAIHRLGGTSLCIHTSGGPIGKMLEECLQKETIPTRVIPVKNWTRENFVAFDAQTQSQYRFGFPGATLSEEELQKIREVIKQAPSKYLILSGSLNQGLSANYYQQITQTAKASGTKVIVDTSGEALQKTLETGVYLVKPNLGELAKLIGVEKLEPDEVAPAAQKLIAKGSAEIVVVSLGPKGAMLVTKNQTLTIPAPKVTIKSTVGAGDSMVGAMAWALSQNKPLVEVVEWGVACGSAATINEGTQLFKIEDAQRLFLELHTSI